MKTDKQIFQIFQAQPQWVFLAGWPAIAWWVQV